MNACVQFSVLSPQQPFPLRNRIDTSICACLSNLIPIWLSATQTYSLMKSQASPDIRHRTGLLVQSTQQSLDSVAVNKYHKANSTRLVCNVNTRRFSQRKAQCFNPNNSLGMRNQVST